MYIQTDRERNRICMLVCFVALYTFGFLSSSSFRCNVSIYFTITLSPCMHVFLGVWVCRLRECLLDMFTNIKHMSISKWKRTGTGTSNSSDRRPQKRKRINKLATARFLKVPQPARSRSRSSQKVKKVKTSFSNPPPRPSPFRSLSPFTKAPLAKKHGKWQRVSRRRSRCRRRRRRHCTCCKMRHS